MARTASSSSSTPSSFTWTNSIYPADLFGNTTGTEAGWAREFHLPGPKVGQEPAEEIRPVCWEVILKLTNPGAEALRVPPLPLLLEKVELHSSNFHRDCPGGISTPEISSLTHSTLIGHMLGEFSQEPILLPPSATLTLVLDLVKLFPLIARLPCRHGGYRSTWAHLQFKPWASALHGGRVDMISLEST